MAQSELALTAPQAHNRLKYIGSSDAAAICGLSPWKSAVDVWMEKTGRKEQPDLSGKKAIRRGAMLEPIIRDVIAREAGIVITHCNVRYIEENGIWVAEIDAEFDAVTGDEVEECNVEIKTANSRKGWGEEWTDQIPDYYMAQVLHAQTVTKRKNTLVVAAFGFDDFRYYMVEHDAELAAWIRQQEELFWQHVQQDIPPEPIALDDAYAAFGVDAGTTIEATPEAVEDVLLWRGLDKQIAGLSDQRDSVELRILKGLREHQALVFNSKPIFTWKSQKHTHLDQQGLKKENPELVKRFTVSKTIRVARAAGGSLWQDQPE